MFSLASPDPPTGGEAIPAQGMCKCFESLWMRDAVNTLDVISALLLALRGTTVTASGVG